MRVPQGVSSTATGDSAGEMKTRNKFVCCSL
jgi:hypothetical protein